VPPEHTGARADPAPQGTDQTMFSKTSFDTGGYAFKTPAATPAAAPALTFDVTEVDFEKAVLERSLDVPVLLDCWAPWCGPCRSLGPVLEKLAQAYGGRFVLAKLNTDEAPQIAAALHVPIVLCVGLYRGGDRYDLHFEMVEEELHVDRRERRQQLQRVVQRYADRLAALVRTAPYNWFNFYDFWNEPAHGGADAGAGGARGASR